MRGKEYGSDFHYISDNRFRLRGKEGNIFSRLPNLYYSGRAALYAIIENGINQLGWQKIYVPSYYCHEVYDFIRPLDIRIEYYNHHPFSRPTDSLFLDEADHVLLAVNYFGISMLDVNQYKNLVVIADLTHDLSAVETSQADYVFGSLRKVLPLPVGGFAKAKEEEFPVSTESLQAEEALLQKWSAMYLKKQYLEKDLDIKPLFRSLFIEAEETFGKEWTNAGLPAAIKPYVFSLDVERIIDTKRKNAEVISYLLRQNDLFEVISASLFNEFGCILRFKNAEDRDLLKKHLIENAIYPFVLWPNQLVATDKAVSDSLLFLHIDFRYDDGDMAYLAETINNFSWYA